MRALVYRGPKKMVLETVPKPVVGPTDVLLKIRSVGICGTDLHIYNGGTDVKPGTILGHELAGDIVAVGRKVTSLKVGQRAVAQHVSCGHCYFCVRGRPNLCQEAKVIGMYRPGAFAEFMAIDAGLVFPFPKSLTYDEACLIGPTSTAVYATGLAGTLLGQTVGVVGQGPIGVLLDQALTAGGAKVIGIDILPHRLAHAKRKGWVDTVLNPKSRDFAKQLKKLAPLGVDIAYEAVGKPATAQLAFDVTRRAGHVIMLGVFEEKPVLNLMDVIKKELRLQGAWTYAFTFPTTIDLLVRKKIDVKGLITHIVDFKDAVQVFADAHRYAGNRMKTIFHLPK